MNSPRIAIFGAGAVGCYFGHLLVESGLEVDFIARGGLVEFQKNGLFVDGYDRELFNVKINVKAKLSGRYDAVLVCVKSKDTHSAAKNIQDHLAENGFVVSLQNGVENCDTMSLVISPERLVSAAIYLTASMQAGRRLKFMSRGKLNFGEYADGGEKYCQIFEKLLERTRIDYCYDKNIKKAQWKKLLLNIAINPLTALLGLTVGKLLTDPHGKSLALNLFNEGVQAAAFNGVDTDGMDFDFVLKQCLVKPEFKTSMLQDVEANKAPEVDAILGVVVRSFEKKGQVAPYSDMLLKIMNIKYGGWFQSSPRLAADVLVGHGRKVLLIERKNEPTGWAIPGGFVDMYESMEAAASRELAEETGVIAPPENLELLGVYSDPARDPRGHTVSAVYVYIGEAEAKAGDDAKRAEYFDIEKLPDTIAFDHRKVLDDYRKKYKLDEK